jgi:hypothetical protein
VPIFRRRRPRRRRRLVILAGLAGAATAIRNRKVAENERRLQQPPR